MFYKIYLGGKHASQVTGNMTIEEHPEVIAILKTPRGKFRYSIRFQKYKEVLKSNEPFSTSMEAYITAVIEAEKFIQLKRKSNGKKKASSNH